MPMTPDGVCRLGGAIREVDEQPAQPVTVWWWDGDAAQERRGTLYGWRVDGQRRLALVVTRGPGDACAIRLRDCVRWVPADHVRERRE